MSEEDANPPVRPTGTEIPKTRATDDPITLSGCLLVADALAARRLATRGFWRRIVVGVGIVAVFSLILIAIGVSSRPYSPKAANVMYFVAGVLFPAILVVPFLWNRFTLHRYANRKYGLFAPTKSVFSSERFMSTSENANFECRWDTFAGYRSNKVVTLLFFANSNSYLIVARSKCKDASEWGRLRSLIASKLPAM